MKQIHTTAFLLLAMLLPGVTQAQAINKIKENNQSKEVNMNHSKNKEKIRQLYEQSLNKNNLSLLAGIISPDYTGGGGKKGAAAFEAPIALLIKAFPDIQWKIEDLVAEDDKVMIRWTWQGTHTGQFQQHAATGRAVSNDGMAVYIFRDGKVIDAQVQTDRLGFLQQLNVLPADVTLLTNRKTYKSRVNFIDKFLVPADAKNEFMERTGINRSFIRKLPGFIEDAVYERTDEQGNFIIVTVAVWKDEEALRQAKDAVQAEYRKQGFNPAEMMQRLHIVMDRGIYAEVGN